MAPKTQSHRNKGRLCRPNNSDSPIVAELAKAKTTLADVARSLGCTREAVSQVVLGRSKSERIVAGLAAATGWTKADVLKSIVAYQQKKILDGIESLGCCKVEKAPAPARRRTRTA